MTVDPAIREIYDTPLEPAEFESRLRDALARVDGPDGDELRELIDWFQRRYPTAEARLAYVRRKMRELRAAHPTAHP